MFQHQKVHIILQKYMPDIDVSQAIGAGKLATAIVRSGLDKTQLNSLANELADYIFKGQPWANTKPLKQAIANPDPDLHTATSNIKKGYLTAAYTAYKQKKDKSNKFDGVMLINFARQELKYFDDPEDMFNDVDSVQFSISHPNAGWGGKLISPSVTLRKEPIPKAELPKKAQNAQLIAWIPQLAEYLIKMAQQRHPQDLDIRDPGFKDAVTSTIKDLVQANYPTSKITAEVLRQYPQLKTKASVDQPPTPAKKEPSNPPMVNKLQQPAELTEALKEVDDFIRILSVINR